MPLATLVVQYAITFALARGLQPSQLHASAAASPFLGFASGLMFAVLGLAFTVFGLLIVYNGTHDIGLTIGYLVIRSIEGYLLSFVLTAAVLTSLGLHPNATKPINGPAITSPSRTAATPNTGSSAEITVPNANGIYLKIAGRVLSVILPPELTVSAQGVTTQNSTVYLNCIPANGPGFSLPPQIQLGPPVAWRLSPSQTPLTTCYGTVTLSHGTRLTKLNQGTNVAGFNLLPWKLSPR